MTDILDQPEVAAAADHGSRAGCREGRGVVEVRFTFGSLKVYRPGRTGKGDLMAFHTHPRRILPSWLAAAQLAAQWGGQTGYKHRVIRTRGVWMVRRTDKRCGPFKPRAVDLGTVRMTINIETGRAG